MSVPSVFFLDEQEITTVMDMAACNFTPVQIAVQLGVDCLKFLNEYNTLGSEIRDAYDAGKLKATFNIMNKQRELAEGGNITAAQIFLKESEKIDFENFKRRLYFGED